MKVLSSTSARAPSAAARSTATAPPKDSPITTTSVSAIFSPRGEPAARCAGVGQDSRLVGAPFAAPVAAVVEDQHRYAGATVQHAQDIVAMTNIAGVSMAKQDGRPGLFVRHVPGMNLRAVGRRAATRPPAPARPAANPLRWPPPGRR